MTFIPISECCLKGSVMTGTPRGVMQLAGEGGITVDRYAVLPSDGEVVSEKIALVLLYDLFGFSLPNPKLMADSYADKLKIAVYIPDYLPNPAPSSYIESSLEHYPDEKKSQGILGAIWDKVRLLPLLPLLPGVLLDSKATPLVDKAITDLQAQGYTTIVSVGYCRGGSMSTYLLSKGDECPLTAAVVMHPAWEPERLPKITKPSLWMLADEDQFITPARRDELAEAFAKNPRAEFKSRFFPNTVHGFGCRPALHEATQEAFHAANAEAVAYLKEKLAI